MKAKMKEARAQLSHVVVKQVKDVSFQQLDRINRHTVDFGSLFDQLGTDIPS